MLVYPLVGNNLEQAMRQGVGLQELLGIIVECTQTLHELGNAVTDGLTGATANPFVHAVFTQEISSCKETVCSFLNRAVHCCGLIYGNFHRAFGLNISHDLSPELGRENDFSAETSESDTQTTLDTAEDRLRRLQERSRSERENPSFERCWTQARTNQIASVSLSKISMISSTTYATQFVFSN